MSQKTGKILAKMSSQYGHNDTTTYCKALKKYDLIFKLKKL